MSALLRLALASAWNRGASLALTCLSIAVAATLSLAVTRLGDSARQGFGQAVSGVDLVVGPRGSALQLLLHALFQLGEAPATLRWDSYLKLAAEPQVAWSLPLALGDFHRGYPVIATHPACFLHLRDAAGRPLSFAAGRPFEARFEAVVGAEVARRLGYRPGDSLALTHGSAPLDDRHDDEGHDSPHSHGDKPFRVVGVLAPTGTPVDRGLLIGLDSLTALHLDWQGGAPVAGLRIPAAQAGRFDLTPRTLDAVLLGLHRRTDALRLQRQIAEAPGEPLMAVLPGPTLDALWQRVGGVERSLQALGGLITVVSLAGLAAVILAGLGERRRELAVLRAVGAGVRHLVALLVMEGLLLTGTGLAAGLILVELGGAVLAPWLSMEYGLIWRAGPSARDGAVLAAFLLAGTLASLLPAWHACRLSLADGLVPRL